MLSITPFTHYALRITHYPLHIPHYALPITHYALHITHYALHITHYALRFLLPLPCHKLPQLLEGSLGAGPAHSVLVLPPSFAYASLEADQPRPAQLGHVVRHGWEAQFQFVRQSLGCARLLREQAHQPQACGVAQRPHHP